MAASRSRRISSVEAIHYLNSLLLDSNQSSFVLSSSIAPHEHFSPSYHFLDLPSGHKVWALSSNTFDIFTPLPHRHFNLKKDCKIVVSGSIIHRPTYSTSLFSQLKRELKFSCTVVPRQLALVWKETVSKKIDISLFCRLDRSLLTLSPLYLLYCIIFRTFRQFILLLLAKNFSSFVFTVFLVIQTTLKSFLIYFSYCIIRLR